MNKLIDKRIKKIQIMEKYEMISRIIYYALSIILVGTLIFVPLIFSYQHVIESHIMAFSLTIKSLIYLVSSSFIFIILFYIKSLKR